jgi:signal transduction histidine kinase
VQETAALIARKADHLSELIRRLRGFGSGADASPAVVGVSQLVSDVVSLASPEARNAGVTIHCVGGPELKASVHDVEIRQALLNLIRNAISAAPESDPIVRVGWSQADRLVRFWIENAVAHHRSAEGGMGLGLIITRTIAQAHGGQLNVEKTSTGVVRSALDLPLSEGQDA